MSFLMRVYEQSEKQRQASIGHQQPRNVNADHQDFDVAGPEKSREWCDDPDFAAYSPLANQPRTAKRDRDLNVTSRSVNSKEWCDHADLEAIKEPCRENYNDQDKIMDTAARVGIESMSSSQAPAYSPLTCRPRNAKRNQDLKVHGTVESRGWSDDAELESPDWWYPEKYADQDKIMESVLTGDNESVSSQGAVVTPMEHRRPGVGAPMNRRPGAYAVMHGQSMQHRQDDAGTTTATLDPTTVAPGELPPIAAEVAEDAQMDLSSHIRRVLAENAVKATSVAAFDGTPQRSDNNTRSDSEMPSGWWRRLILVFLCLILLAVAAAVAVVVVMLTKDPDPTTTITVAIKLDDHPEETGWELHQDNEEIAAFPPGEYNGQNNATITAQITEVYIGEEYTFTLFDAGGNGIDGGYYKIYDAPDTSDPSTILVEGSGDFTDQVRHSFVPEGQKTNEEDEVNPGLQGSEEECIDCEVTDWSGWSPCSAVCNGGIRSRTRTAMIPGNQCGNPCPAFVETERCNTEPCPNECPHECCGNTDCQEDEKCLDNECNPVCECNCPEAYTCNVEANCECICPYDCCDDGDCNGDVRCFDNECVTTSATTPEEMTTTTVKKTTTSTTTTVEKTITSTTTPEKTTTSTTTPEKTTATTFSDGVCDDNPCGNGECIETGGTDGSYDCDCNKGYYFNYQTCESVYDRCDSNPCPGELCLPEEDDIDDVQCVPDPCDDCINGDCTRHGDTYWEWWIDQEGSYDCDCEPDWSGKNCDRAVCQCESPYICNDYDECICSYECCFNQDCNLESSVHDFICENNKCTAEDSGPKPVIYNIYIMNGCHKDVNVAIMFKDPQSDSWTVKCWYGFVAGEGSFMATGGERIETTSTVWYYYAESTDGTLTWEGTNSDARERTCNGETLSMIKKSFVDSDGDLYMKLTCNDGRILLQGEQEDQGTASLKPRDD